MRIDISRMNYKTYKDLIEYAMKKCNVVSFFKYNNQHLEEYNAIKNLFLNYTDFDNFFEYGEIEDIAKKYANNIEMKKYHLLVILKCGPENSVPVDSSSIHSNLFIKHYLEQVYYERETDSFLQKNNEKLLSKKDIYFDRKVLKRNHINELNLPFVYGTEYKFQLDSDMLEHLMYGKKSILDWDFPKSIMDICFYVNDNCWLSSIAHENWCSIECENKEEYDYLVSIGIDFEEKFVDDME